MPNATGERCGGENPKTSPAKSPDDNPEPLAEACGSTAFARQTGSAIHGSSTQKSPAKISRLAATAGEATAPEM
jgi:hypothetical protein